MKIVGVASLVTKAEQADVATLYTLGQTVGNLIADAENPTPSSQSSPQSSGNGASGNGSGEISPDALPAGMTMAQYWADMNQSEPGDAPITLTNAAFQPGPDFIPAGSPNSPGAGIVLDGGSVNDSNGSSAIGQHLVGVNKDGNIVYASHDTTTPNGADGATDVGEIVVTAQKQTSETDAGSSNASNNSGYILAAYNGPSVRSYTPSEHSVELSDYAHTKMFSATGRFTVTITDGEGYHVDADPEGPPYLAADEVTVYIHYLDKPIIGGPDYYGGNPQIFQNNTNDKVQMVAQPGASTTITGRNGGGNYSITVSPQLTAGHVQVKISTYY